MKKFLLIAIAIMTLSIKTFAEETKRTPQTQIIELDFKGCDKDGAIHRTPIKMNVEIVFDYECKCLYVSGEADAEVNLYFDGRLIEHSDSLNTTFYVSESDGIYMLEIIADSWSAIGYVEV